MKERKEMSRDSNSAASNLVCFLLGAAVGAAVGVVAGAARAVPLSRRDRSGKRDRTDMIPPDVMMAGDWQR
jgi:hypothetical protein